MSVAYYMPDTYSPKGAWSAGTYYFNDVVQRNGSSWVCVAQSTATTPGSSSDWAAFAAKGDPTNIGTQFVGQACDPSPSGQYTSYIVPDVPTSPVRVFLNGIAQSEGVDFTFSDSRHFSFFVSRSALDRVTADYFA